MTDQQSSRGTGAASGSAQPPRFAVRGRLADLTPDAQRALVERGRVANAELTRRVADIIESVRREGDAALTRYARTFDGVALDAFEVSRDHCSAALDALDPAVRDALDIARDSIARFHRAQLPVPQELEVAPGVRLGRRPDPLRSVGVYAPGGRAAYASSVLMGVVPAKVAGVSEVIVCSPPGPDGGPPSAVLAACALAGADRVFALGGAGAVAALAYGTATVPRVDKIVGPGNAWVTEAKRQLDGSVAIDCPAGPSEVLIVADETADARIVAAELLAQAEHDAAAAAVLVTTDARLLDAVPDALAPLLATQPRRTTVQEALASRGALLLADDLDEALRFAERYAPEHLLLLTANPRALLDRVRSAGSVFLGASSSVAFGDYVTGANHVLPTAGLARAWSGLSSADFVRWTTIQEVSEDAARRLAGPAAALADAEGLPGHALAARMRGLDDGGSGNDRTTTGSQSTMSSPGDEARERTRSGPHLRAAYAAIHLYDPGRVPTPVDLSDNTNLFGPSPAVADVLAGPPPPLVTRYPSVYANPLKTALAQRFGVEPANVTTGCGSDDVIDSAVRAFCEPGDRLAYPAPTFGVVPLFARMNAVTPIELVLAADFALDADIVIAARSRLIYLCRPNNPTGNVFERACVERVTHEAEAIVIIDEAYADFADDDFVAYAARSDRTVVLRTFSKAFALAGLRVGFAIGPEPLIREIEKSRGPYKVSALAEVAALAALEHDADWVRDRVAQVRESRQRLTHELARLGMPALPSAANFLLVPVPPALATAQACTAALRAQGVQVRAFPGLPYAGDCIRVTVGPWPMMDAFLIALRTVIERVTRGRPVRGESGAGPAR